MAKKKPIISSLGQWAYPGEVTIIPSSKITMKGVNYPVLGVDDFGNSQVMMPGAEYEFPGNYVTEYPQMGKGGEMIKRKDGSYSKRGLWDNIRANKGSGKKPTKQMLEQERKIKAKMQDGGWLDEYGVGGPIKKKKVTPKYTSDNPEYTYDQKGNLYYKSINKDVPVVDKIKLNKLYPTLGEVAETMGLNAPIDAIYKNPENKLVMPPSRFLNQLIDDYIKPNVIGKKFGEIEQNTGNFLDEGYSKNRTWVSNPLSSIDTTMRNLDGPNLNAYFLKPNKTIPGYTDVKNTQTEGDVNVNQALNPGKELVPREQNSEKYNTGNNWFTPYNTWNRSRQMAVEMQNNPKIKEWAKLHNIDLSSKPRTSEEASRETQSGEYFAPKLAEQINANRGVKAGDDIVGPPLSNNYNTRIIQNPNAFDLVGYGDKDKINKFTAKYKKENNINGPYESIPYEKQAEYKQRLFKELGINADPNEVYIHFNRSPLTEYAPGMRNGGWLKRYQVAGEVSTEQNPERMNPIEIQTERKPWYERLPRQIGNKIGLDPYHLDDKDFGSQFRQRVSDATGGADWYKQSNPFMNLALEAMNAPQLAATYGVTGKVQTPSEAMDIQNPYGAFAVDMLLDPAVAFGLTKGLVKGAPLVAKYAKTAGKKLGKSITKDVAFTPTINNFSKFDELTPQSMDDIYHRVVNSPGYSDDVQKAIDYWQEYKHVSPELDKSFTLELGEDLPLTRRLKTPLAFDENGYVINSGKPISFSAGLGNDLLGQHRVHLMAPKGTKVSPISRAASSTTMQGEREILFPTTSKFKKLHSRVNPQTGLEDYIIGLEQKNGGQTNWLNKYK